MTDHKCEDIPNMSHLQLSRFNIIHTNIRSLHKNISLFEAHITPKTNIDVIIFTETWTSTDSLLPQLNNFAMIHIPHPDPKTKKSKNHGGIVIYYKPSLKIELLLTTSNELCQTSLVHFPDFNIYILAVYRYPNSSISLFSKYLNDTIANGLLKNNIELLVLIGDINININCAKRSREYCKLLKTFNFLNGNTQDTRITSKSSTMIDHVYFKKEPTCQSKTYSGNIKTAITDHSIIFFSLDLNHNEEIPVKYSRCLKSEFKTFRFVSSIKGKSFP